LHGAAGVRPSFTFKYRTVIRGHRDGPEQRANLGMARGSAPMVGCRGGEADYQFRWARQRSWR